MLHEKLVCYREAVLLAQGFCNEGARWPRGFGYLFDQLRRAMSSVVLNIAEGNAKVSRPDRRRFFRIARASTAEVAACVDLMIAFGLTSKEQGSHDKTQLELVSKLLWGLIR